MVETILLPHTKVETFKGVLKDKEIPGSRLGFTIAHDVVHELALLTDERGLIDAKSFVDVYVFFIWISHSHLFNKLAYYMYTQSIPLSLAI